MGVANVYAKSNYGGCVLTKPWGFKNMIRTTTTSQSRTFVAIREPPSGSKNRRN